MNRSSLKALFTLILIGLSVHLLMPHAVASTTLDAGFAPVLSTAGTITTIVPLADSKVLVVGSFTTINGTPRKNIARLNADGSVDTAFQLDSRIPADMIYAAAVQDDGKILIGGQIYVYGATESQTWLFRLESNGVWDTSFVAGRYVYSSAETYGLDGAVRAIVVDPNGKILVGGEFTGPRSHIARLNADGSEDTSFDPGSGTDATVTHIALQSTDHIIIGGVFATVNGTAKAGIARLSSSGSLDAAAFGSGIAGGSLLTLALQGDMLLLGGTFNSLNGTTVPKLVRTTDEGALDASFTQVYNSDTGSKVGDQLQAVTSLVVLVDKIVVGGWYTAYIGMFETHDAQLYVLQLNNGAFVNSVSFKGKPTDVWALAKRSDELAVAGGSFTQLDDGTDAYYYGICQLDPGNYYRPLASWKPVIGGQADIRSLTLQGDEKLLVGGDFYLANGVAKNGVARFNSNGSLDSTLTVPATAGGVVTGTLVRDDGNLVMGGSFSDIADQTYKDVALLDPTGTLMLTTYVGGVNALAWYPGGKILVAMSNTPGVKRLNADLSVDATFDLGTGITNVQQSDLEFDRVNAVAVQADGKILVGGSFFSFNGVSVQNILRLNSDGSIDATFVSPAFTVFNGRSELFAIAVQPDNKILLAGRFSTVGGVASPTVVRLNANGSVDTTFHTPFTDQGSTAYALALQADGRILVGGNMQIIEGPNIYNSLVRLHPTGSRDSSFASSLTGTVKSILVHASQLQLTVGGTIEAVDATARQGVARFTMTPEYLLTVTRSSVGGGSVTASSGTISWNDTVGMAAYDSGTSVTLTAQPAAGYSFSGWSGEGCSGTGTCTVSMSAARSVSATFAVAPQETLNLTLSGSGAGSVISTPSGIDCPASSCSGQFTAGSTVTLTAVPNASSSFDGWIGAQSTAGVSCGVLMNVVREVTALFNTAKARIGAVNYSTLAEAYVTDFGASPILLLDGDLGESLTVEKSVTLKGGYNASFSGLTGLFTNLTAPLTVSSGTLTVERIEVK